MRKNQAGFGAFGIILLLLLSAVIGFAGWRVYESQQQFDATTQAEKTAVVPHQITQNSETETTNGLVAYKNLTLGISFTYPAIWGKEPQVENVSNDQAFKISFDNKPTIHAGVMKRSFKPAGSDGQCYVMLGIYPFDDLSSIKKSQRYGDMQGEGYKTTSKQLISDATTLVTESFEAGAIEGLGACPGLSIAAYKEFAKPSTLTGIEFFWHDDDASAPPLAQYDVYQTDPDTFITPAGRQAFIDVVNSAKAL